MTRPPTVHCLQMVSPPFFLLIITSCSWGTGAPAFLTSVSSVKSFLYFFPLSSSLFLAAAHRALPTPRHLSGVHPAHVHGWLLGNKSWLSVNHISKEIHKSCSCLEHINPYCHEYCRHESLGLHTNFGPSH